MGRARGAARAQQMGVIACGAMDAIRWYLTAAGGSDVSRL
ncbi:hypothetical protein I546_1622 [Mycobacterium kansasii 732]|uniref:Uncharacterized protein n=1 Tax=Mycobacterium kansasii TaxID=1768 RepID=A0A1V3XJ75_MYCKA|nr:hypothetical protein I546_1622 [Mycobacterium kansasii 732]OOK79140.1 hypothetical protein BZL30_1633 [Mycobacterium kansasii]